jgi:calmodulin
MPRSKNSNMAGNKSISEWEKKFKEADLDNNGTLDVFELRGLLRKGNSNMTDSQIADSFLLFDGPTGDRRITLDEFVKGLQKVEDFIKKLTAYFKQYDADNSGFLDKDELKKILGASGHKFTEAEINDILKKADKNGDNKISFPEFLEACT